MQDAPFFGKAWDRENLSRSTEQQILVLECFLDTEQADYYSSYVIEFYTSCIIAVDTLALRRATLNDFRSKVKGHPIVTK